ncbi:MAG: DUF370 domain-containing protein [Leptospiraceae bacterium]|nr:DUF370 domain-containing protein [Leptospiraceae bacterium]
MKLLHVGFHNIVAVEKIVAILYPETAAARRIRDDGKEKNTLIDCTMGRKVRSLIITDSPYCFLSAMRPEALLARLSDKNKDQDSQIDDDEDDD